MPKTLKKPKHPVVKASKRRPGGSESPFGPPPKSTRLLDAIKQILSSTSDDDSGKTRVMVAAEAYVRACESGSFIHMKEILDRDEGKVPTRIANSDGENIKAYVGIPIDGDEAP